jgi:hypothetical protein
MDDVKDKAETAKDEIEDNPCETDFELPYYLKEWYEKTVLPVTYQYISKQLFRDGREPSQRLTRQKYVDFAKEKYNKIAAITVRSFSKCAAEEAMKNDEILPLYLSKRIISIFDLKPQLKVVEMPISQGDKYAPKDQQFYEQEFENSFLYDEMTDALKRAKDATNTYWDNQISIINRELSIVFDDAENVGKTNSIPKRLTIVNSFENLNDAFQSYEIFAVNRNKTTLLLRTLDYFSKKLKIKNQPS